MLVNVSFLSLSLSLSISLSLSLSLSLEFSLSLSLLILLLGLISSAALAKHQHPDHLWLRCVGPQGPAGRLGAAEVFQQGGA